MRAWVMLTARAGRLRDWALFAAAAIAPAIAVGILGLRAMENEAAGARRAVALELTTASAQLSRDVEQSTARATAALAAERIEGDPDKAAAALGRIAPPFAEPVVLAPDRSVVYPPPPRPPPATPAPPRCRALASALASPSAAEAAAARRDFLADCVEARTPEGRWLWPVVALDAVLHREAAAEAIPGWIEAHAAVLAEAERAATVIEAQEVLAGPARERALAALRTPWSRRDALLGELRRERAEAAMRGPPDRNGVVAWRAGSSIGALRALEEGKLAGFVIHRASLEAWLRSDAHAAPAGVLAQVVGAAPAATGPDDPPAAVAMIAPELGVRLSPADPAAVARHAAFGRRLLAGIGVGTMALAFGLAALLFARMRAARRVGELRTDFVAAVSHELRTPIASVRMLAELLEEGRLEPEEHREVYEALAREARRLGETVDRLLSFSRMAAGRQALERSPGSVAAVVAASIDTFEERNPDMPKVERALDEALRASIDPGQIRLAVDNLLVNARKYAPDGAPYRVVVERAEGGVRITVIDRGPGIARRDQRRIFEPFERADDRLSRATEGSGIGLSLVRHAAKSHGGRAFVESEPGRGASFTIWIPMAAEGER